ncbi:phospholipase D-like domain-containing protein [Acetobacter sicerae]|uniref:hypothetical protein n=1 Tax=Acetobacter sicerae TaxID=85325 RepID=UPI00156AE623|nr:hypothetical protein [Acetobacter sicerae]NHN93612.1 hypothetical protein [Acetobacter sicerae]
MQELTTRYETGERLRDAILTVMAGGHPRMCVAFLGPSWVEDLFKGVLPKNAKVICDLRMGATVRAALKAGGAPNNKRLRHLPDQEMHGKIYLSDKGAVVCSANASKAALSGSNRIEDGIYVTPGSDMYHDICQQFALRFKVAKQIDQPAVDHAPLFGPAGQLPSGLTLINALRQNASAFKGIYFVCSTEVVDKAIRDAADQKLAEEDKYVSEGNTSSTARHEHFSNWGILPAEWPALFFSVHRGPRGGIHLSKNDSSRFLEGVQGTDGREIEDVFVSRRLDWNAIGPAFGDLPRLASLRDCRDELKTIFPTEESFKFYEGKILTGDKFVAHLPKNEEE